MYNVTFVCDVFSSLPVCVMALKNYNTLPDGIHTLLNLGLKTILFIMSVTDFTLSIHFKTCLYKYHYGEV
jgi:hypothetical protein